MDEEGEGREGELKCYRHTDIQTDIQTYRQTYRHTDRHTDPPTKRVLEEHSLLIMLIFIKAITL